MCDLVTAGIVMTVASTAVSTIGAAQQAQAQQAQFEYKAAVDRNNALLAQYQAEDAIKRGAQEAETQREKVQQMIGKQRAAFGASGLQVNTGTALLIQEDTAELGELDALTIENNAEREAQALRMRSENFSASARMNDFAGSQISPFMAGATSLLSGVGDAVSMGAKYKRYKGPS